MLVLRRFIGFAKGDADVMSVRKGGYGSSILMIVTVNKLKKIESLIRILGSCYGY
jgi:pectate lyase